MSRDYNSGICLEALSPPRDNGSYSPGGRGTLPEMRWGNLSVPVHLSYVTVLIHITLDQTPKCTLKQN